MSNPARANWDGLSPTWQALIRQSNPYVTLGDPPGDDELESLFGAYQVRLSGPVPVQEPGLEGGAPTALDLTPLTLFAQMQELHVGDGLSLLRLPVLPQIRLLRLTNPAPLPDDIGTRLPGLERVELPPMARDARALSSLRASEAEVVTEPGMDLAALAHLPALRRLLLSDGPVDQVPSLAAVTGLVALDLRYTNLTDLGPLAALGNLQELILGPADLDDLTPLASLKQLEVLCLSGCSRLRDLLPLRHLTKLSTLRLSQTAVTDLAPLAGLSSLTSLELLGTQVSDLSPLSRSSGLAELVACETPIHDLTPLAALPALRTLNLRGTQVVDIRPLLGLAGLTSVNLEQTEVSWTDGDALKAKLGPEANVGYAPRPSADFPGLLDAAAYAVVEQLFASKAIATTCGLVKVGGGMPVRPGDYNYAVTRMAFDPQQSLWTLWLDVYGGEVEIQLWGARGVRVGPMEFRVRGADRIVYDGRECAFTRGDAFLLG